MSFFCFVNPFLVPSCAIKSSSLCWAEEANAVPSSSETSTKKKKKYVKRVDRILNEIRSKKVVETPAGTSSQQVVQPVILVVPTDNIAATVEAIK
ncbi:hypothetical protein OSTOST_09927, partial [Ostertagia ostertagi]